MKAAFFDFIAFLNGVFVSPSRSIAFTIGSVPVDPLYGIVSCAITARFRKGRKPVVGSLCTRQRSSRSKWIVIRSGLNRKVCTHQSSCPRKVLSDLDLDIAQIAFSGLPLSLLFVGIV